MAEAQAKFLQGNLFRHVTVMSMTASVGMMTLFLVDLVDMLFISMLGKEELAAAVGYAGAILFFTTSFGIGVAISAGALVARALGAGDRQMAERRAATSLLYGFLFAVVFAAVVWMNLRSLASLMGASGTTLDLTVGYLQIIIPSLPLLLLGMVGGAILRAHGDARRAMMSTIAGAVVNAVLDPILIFGLDMELSGAAVASVCARGAIAFVALYPLVRVHKALAKPTPAQFRLDFAAIVAIAGPAILTQLATPIGQAYVTRSMAEFGEDAVAGMAIVGRLTPVAFGVLFALSGAVGPIIGQNFGANQQSRVRDAFRAGLVFAAAWVVFAAIVLFFLRGPVVGMFGAEGSAITLIYLFCGPLALLYYFNGVIFVANAAFNNLGHPFYSTLINWGRNTLGIVPLVWLGAHFWGASGVLIGQAAGGVVFAGVAFALSQRVMAHQTPVTPEPFARQGRLHALLHMRR